MATAPIPFQIGNPITGVIQLNHPYTDVTMLEIVVDTFDSGITLFKASKTPKVGYHQEYLTGYSGYKVFLSVPKEITMTAPEETFFLRLKYQANDVNAPGGVYYEDGVSPFILITA